MIEFAAPNAVREKRELLSGSAGDESRQRAEIARWRLRLTVFPGNPSDDGTSLPLMNARFVSLVRLVSSFASVPLSIPSARCPIGARVIAVSLVGPFGEKNLPTL